MKPVGFFSSWVLKSCEADRIDEVYYDKKEDMLWTESGFLSEQQRTEEAGHTVLACLDCRAA